MNAIKLPLQIFKYKQQVTLLYKVSAALNVRKRAQNQHEQTDMWPSVQPHLFEQSIFW
jgi:hypothetical protein